MLHQDEVIRLLEAQISNAEEVEDIRNTAERVSRKWVSPLSGGKEEINGLIYGLVQSGKTGVLAVTGAMGVDEGYRTIIVLTSDNDALYDQTLTRIREAYPGIDILGKSEFKDSSFVQRVKHGNTAIVTSKNSRILGNLVENFRSGGVRGLQALIIDDEADQASLNTKTKKADGTRSAINGHIVRLREFFDKNTYLQVTATPQALFLQDPKHDFRPQFTVLSHPGSGYVGGDDFFADESSLVRTFNITELQSLSPGGQPTPRLVVPRSLERALDVFMIGATYKRRVDATQNCAFLCHVSTRTSDHKHIVEVMRRYKEDLVSKLNGQSAAVSKRLREAYNHLANTHPDLATRSFDSLVDALKFYSPGINIKLVNGQTDEDVSVTAPYNLFVGGNKLGRGVTIKNLLVSYYGRNPKKPQADTVLQHARMYGYRRKDLGLLRLYLPQQLNVVFRAIHQMEKALRVLISKGGGEKFRGIYIEGNLKPTRTSVIAPGAVGIYTGGGGYNPAQILRDETVSSRTAKLDQALRQVTNRGFAEVPLGKLVELLKETSPDPEYSEQVWNGDALAGSVVQMAEILKQSTGYVYVDRERDLKEARRETQGILSGGEEGSVPRDKLTLFMLRTKPRGSRKAAWWPQIRFPAGNYAFAFAI